MSPDPDDAAPPPRNGVGLAALVLGIFALAFVFIPFTGEVLTVPAGIAAVTAGFIGWDRADRGIASNRGDALVGGVLGAVALMVTLLIYAATSSDA
ncbi:hypothetical protein [Nocardia cyriacigeorgica]|uniref:hypothetical protein n=1 Tax=Nocardia cyriacigeorgica TaxID=135487 RepID=UPI002457A141|nr:hypothetical protein [Nocardia cyriacigeorgica]